MKYRVGRLPRTVRILTLLLMSTAMLSAQRAKALELFFPLGFGAPGIPGSFAYENFFSYQTGAGHTIGNVHELAFFTKTGVTGTTRDQFEIFTFFGEGYTNPHGLPSINDGTSFGNLQFGLVYFYNLVVPKAIDPDLPAYTTYWIAPTIQLNFPNGNNSLAGFGSGRNQFSYYMNIQNYIRVGKFAVTFVPISATYFDNNLNPALSPAQSRTFDSITQFANRRGGLSVSTGIVNAQYHITKDFWLGLYHQINFNNFAGKTTNFGPSTIEGSIGPAIEYDGFADHNFYLQGTIQKDYYHSPSLKDNTSFLFHIFKYIDPDRQQPTANEAASGQ